MQTILRAFVAVIFLGTLLAGASAHADPLARPASPQARNHLTLGNRLYGVRSFDEAVAEYKAGALIEPAPVFDYNLGQCFRQLGRYQEAIWHYERFLSRGSPEGELLDAVNGFIAQMKSEVERKAMTQEPTEPEPAQHAVAAATPQPQGLRMIQPRDAWYHDRIGWGLVGVGVAAAGVGGALLINAANVDDEANSTPDQRQRDQLRDKANRRSLLGTVFGLGGAGLLVSGIIKLVVHPDASPPVTTWSISPSGNGVTLVGVF